MQVDKISEKFDSQQQSGSPSISIFFCILIYSVGSVSSHWSDFSSVTKVRQNINEGKTTHMKEIKVGVDDCEQWLLQFNLQLLYYAYPDINTPMYDNLH